MSEPTNPGDLILPEENSKEENTPPKPETEQKKKPRKRFAERLAMALTGFIGQNLGAGKIERIGRGVRAANITGCLTAVGIAVFMGLFGKQIIGSFISGTPEEVAQAVRIGCEFLWVMSIALPVLYILHVVRSALQGLGDTMMPMLSGIAEFVMRTGSALLLPAVIGYKGVFWAEVFAWTGADVILVISYFVLMRKLRRRGEQG